MLLFRDKDIPPDLVEFFEPVQSGPEDVLRPSPENFKGQHYATFPRSLIAPLIQASCPTRCCSVCGAGWAPVVERESTTIPVEERHGRVGHNGQPPQQSGWFWERPESAVLGYRPTCDCRVSTAGVKASFGLTDPALPDEVVPPSVPGLLLDPFFGSGTTALVGKELGLRCIGLDLSAEYLDGQASVRVLGHTPAGALDELPLFAELERETSG